MRILKTFIVAISIFLIVLFAGAYVYHLIEGWSYLDSLYFVVITATTVGYGDFSPKTDAGKVFTILFVFFGVSMAIYFLNLFARYFSGKSLHEKLKKDGRIKNNRGVKRVK